MWESARNQVAEVFFKDTVRIYRNAVVEDDIGEEHNEPVLVGTYICNIENGTSSTTQNMSGISVPQTLRISLPKDTPLDYNNTYVIVIESARIRFSEEDWWNVDGWVEGQISTVITASRRNSI